MSELRDIYETLRALGLCSTQAEFSRQWLGRSDHYMSQINGDPRKASLTSLQLLYTRIDLARQHAKGSNNIAEHRILHDAYVTARTVFNGVFELRHVPPWYWVTAQG